MKLSFDLIVLLLALTASVLIVVSYAIHWSRVTKSEVIVPDLKYMDDLEKNVQKMRNTRLEHIKANQWLKMRSADLKETTERSMKESDRNTYDYIIKTYLQTREHSEEAAGAYYDNQSAQ